MSEPEASPPPHPSSEPGRPWPSVYRGSTPIHRPAAIGDAGRGVPCRGWLGTHDAWWLTSVSLAGQRPWPAPDCRELALPDCICIRSFDPVTVHADGHIDCELTWPEACGGGSARPMQHRNRTSREATPRGALHHGCQDISQRAIPRSVTGYPYRARSISCPMWSSTWLLVRRSWYRASAAASGHAANAARGQHLGTRHKHVGEHVSAASPASVPCRLWYTTWRLLGGIAGCSNDAASRWACRPSGRRRCTCIAW